MPQRFQFLAPVLQSVVGGKSAIDLPRLNIKSEEEAEAFLNGYGFNLKDEIQVKKIWYYHRRALVLMEEKLGIRLSEIPEEVRDPKSLVDIRKLLLWASSDHPGEKHLQRWSCTLLRVMHVFMHAESDLFASFSEEIQKQILTPIQDCVYHDGSTGLTFLKRPEKVGQNGGEQIGLQGFEVKPFKTSSSTVIKLLAKPDALAMSVYDKLGVRFVTKTMFDVFCVIRFLVSENLISFPHIMPDQSSNNLYPADLFIEVANELAGRATGLSEDQIDKYFLKRLEERKDEFGILRKQNAFSGHDYRFIKFICRKLIRIHPIGQKESFGFFFPFEVQIMDEKSHRSILSGPSEHEAYKERQKMAARKRIMPDLESQ
ncbi:MAG: hypothetical protein BroJett040_20790 [Oligoflexia bacterium]|nr:MAG: hypothetical protein BroJett040_20790 [Oligoflexia bacterium]